MRVRALVVAVLVVMGLALRLRGLGEGTLFIDEAESSLNALSILEHGYPADHYLGQPMFENTLTEPWPESAEYEFRDTSYSSRGVATYHGWLPLYAIALSQVLHGVHPDVATVPPRVQHEGDEIARRIRAARLPAVAFGLLFLLAMYAAGCALHGPEAGLVALLAATVSPKCVWLSQQARYYSAGLAFTALFVLAVWNAARFGRWRDSLAAAIVFVLLFHTNSLAALVALPPALLCLPAFWRHEGAPLKLMACCGVVALGLVPWMLWSGFFEHLGRVPPARATLSAADYFVYLSQRATRVGAGALALALFLLSWCLRGQLRPRLAQALETALRPVLYLSAAILSAYFGFQLLAPAASCSMARLSHLLVVPPILMGAIGVALVARCLRPASSQTLALGLALALLAAQGGMFRRQERNPSEAAAVFELVEHLRGLELAPDARLYAWPYQHFVLTYYTGIAVQSIAPVRGEFLREHPGEVVILETASRHPRPRPDCTVRAAARAGFALEATEAEAWGASLQQELVRAELDFVARVEPPAPAMPAWVAPTLAYLPDELAHAGQGRIDYASDNPALFGRLPPLSHAEFWPHFFYRFVGPEARSGPALNYLERAQGADATLLASGWVVLRCAPAGGGA
jgi:hypothetical protein